MVLIPGMITALELDGLEAQIRQNQPKRRWRAAVDAITADPWTRWFLRERLHLESATGCSYVWGNPADPHRCMQPKGHIWNRGHRTTPHRCNCGLTTAARTYPTRRQAARINENPFANRNTPPH